MKLEMPLSLNSLLGTDDQSKNNNVHASSLHMRKNQPLDESWLFQFNPSASVRTAGSMVSLPDSLTSRFNRGMAAESFNEHTEYLKGICLRSSYGLRTQLLLSFGLITTATIGFVICTCVVVAIVAGNSIQYIHQESLKDYLTNIEATSARFLAEQLSPKLIPSGAVNILYEATLDRFAGYPFVTSDSVVPFMDQISQTGKYPVEGAPVPLDWQIRDDAEQVTEENYLEHLQHQRRWEELYKDAPYISTDSAFYSMQGSCDPNQPASTHTYYPGCTDANNNITTGGVVAPTSLNSIIHRKASDLVPLLKALYEYHTDLKDIGIYFTNAGAGSAVTFPHYWHDGSISYVSGGCDWMAKRNPILYDKNNLTQPIASEEERQNCHKKGEVVAGREYNSLERSWCQQQALHPERIHVEGPYWDAFNENIPLLSIGRSVYDRVTHELVACIYLGYTVSSVQQIIEETTKASYPNINGTMETTVVRWDELGTVVATSREVVDSTTTTIDEIDVGVTLDIYQDIYTLVDFEEVWDPDEVQEAYDSLLITHEGVFLSAYPIPPVPNAYDPYYHPDFLVVSSLHKKAIVDHIKGINDGVDAQVEDVIVNSILVGAAGIGAVMVIIFIMAHSITTPLRQMDQRATEMLENFGASHNDEEEERSSAGGESDAKLMKQRSSSTAPVLESDNSLDKSSHSPQQKPTIDTNLCTPRTELAKLTEAFEEMVASFSGASSMSRATKHIGKDIENNFQLGEEKMFQDLYIGRQASGFKYQISIVPRHGPRDPLNHFVNRGRVVIGRDDTVSQVTMEQFKSEPSPTCKQRKKPWSALFLRIVLLIGTPLLITTLIISVDVLARISNEFLAGVDDAKDLYMDIELQALAAHTGARAQLASSITSESVRDLHIMTRYASWLLFGGINPKESFTSMTSGSQVCKDEKNYRDCDYVKENYVCDCAWNDVTTGGTCQTYDVHRDTRYLQQVTYTGQMDDSWADGDRNVSNYPSNSYLPNATNWWLEYANMPGSDLGTTSRGHDTSYERLRMASANPMHMALYNYDIKKEHALSSYVAFEADGMIVGYSGCRSYSNSKMPFWKSSESNGAAEVRPELCPLGKYGYDPRCREWYGTGKEMAEIDEGALYITPPYKFQSAPIYAHSATTPLRDPITKEHVGQVLVDFRTDIIFQALEEETPLARGGFPILITSKKDGVAQAETVIGPNFSRSETARPIAPLVLEKEQNCNSTVCEVNRNAFEDVVRAMQNGESNRTAFYRLREDGTQEKVYIAFAPVLVKSYCPVNSSDFARGVKESEYLVYSLALAETEEGALEPFEAVEKSTEKQVYIAIGVLTLAIAVALVAVLFFSHRVATSITEPMLFLHDLIVSINTMDNDDNHHQLGHYKGRGSAELVNFSLTLETLYSVVRNVNTAYYAGDLDKAYYVMLDSLRLFRSLGNKKAIGVACNNLGNILFAAVRRMNRKGEKNLFGRSLPSLITKGVEYFTEAIRLGEKAYDDFYDAEGWTPNCLAFMQHLSNRYFNRAMFLLTVKDKHREPEELEKLGLRDLQIAFDMDVEISDQGEETGWGRVDRDQQLFEVALLRARGHILLQEQGYPDDWEVEETLDRAFNLVKNCISRPGQSGMFDGIGPVGRLQQIETELMRYKLLKGETKLGALIAIRLLKEDQYVLPRAYGVALQVLTSYAIEQRGGTIPADEDPLLYSLEMATDDLVATLQDVQSRDDLASEELDVIRQSLQNRMIGHVIDATLEDYRAMDSVTMEDF